MLSRFKKFIESEQLFESTERILLGVSGGMDSIVMTRLFQKSGFNYAIAHCNFGLRGTESDEDEKFVNELADQFNISFFSKRFDTATFSKSQKVSTQMAARELRFTWFEALRKKHNYDYIAIASHKDDELETVLINLVKGAVLGGLHGILEKNGKIIRPMMCFTREDIEQYINDYEIPYRTDSSNTSLKYIRNKLRHQVVPVLKEINPDLLTTLGRNIKRTRLVECVFQEAIEKKTKNLVIQENERWIIKLNDLKKLLPLEPYLYHVLYPFGFRNIMVEKIAKTLNGSIGKVFSSPGYDLLVDRKAILIYKKETSDSDCSTQIDAVDLYTTAPVALKLHRFTSGTEPIVWKKHIAYLDETKLNYPLTLRRWRRGDKFKPLGMNGFKKISDYLIDEKIPHLEKKNVYVLENKGEIAWIIGHRIDDRYKLQPNTIQILKLSPNNSNEK